MRPEDCTYFDSRAAFRAWLAAHHVSADLLHVGFYKKGSGLPSVTYSEAVDEALCFGWIDGVRHAVDALSFTVRFTPRRRGSRWSAVNIKRVEALIGAGLMHEAGLHAFDATGGRRRLLPREPSFPAFGAVPLPSTSCGSGLDLLR